MGATTWTDEQVEKLIELDDGKLSRKEIADEISCHFKKYFSKNAVIGKLNRLKRKSQYRKPQKPPVELPKQTGMDGTKTIHDIGQNDCRYPCKNGMMCGKPQEYKSWCMDHAKKVYQTDEEGNIKKPEPKSGTKKDRFGKVWE